jgi:hypothetical protein
MSGPTVYSETMRLLQILKASKGRRDGKFEARMWDLEAGTQQGLSPSTLAWSVLNQDILVSAQLAAEKNVTMAEYNRLTQFANEHGLWVMPEAAA